MVAVDEVVEHDPADEVNRYTGLNGGERLCFGGILEGCDAAARRAFLEGGSHYMTTASLAPALHTLAMRNT
jgi:hypothetical protein